MRSILKVNGTRSSTKKRFRQENKPRTTCIVKQNLIYETYLDFDKDYHRRQIITKLRTSAHRLEIEMGPYTANGKVNVENRICIMLHGQN